MLLVSADVQEPPRLIAGLVLADGLAERERGGGMKRVICMACASMVRSTNISIVPGPGRGGKKRRPVIEINE